MYENQKAAGQLYFTTDEKHSGKLGPLCGSKGHQQWTGELLTRMFGVWGTKVRTLSRPQRAYGLFRKERIVKRILKLKLK